MAVYGVILAGWATNSRYAFLGAMRSAAQSSPTRSPWGSRWWACSWLAAASTSAHRRSAVGWLSFVVPAATVSSVFGLLHCRYCGNEPGTLRCCGGRIGNRRRLSCRIFRRRVCDFFPGGIREHDPYFRPDGGFVLRWLAFAFRGTSICFLDGTLFAALRWESLLAGAKIAFFLFCFLWLRATFPRYRYDQIMRLGWKVLIPMTLVWIIAEGCWCGCKIGPWAVHDRSGHQ